MQPLLPTEATLMAGEGGCEDARLKGYPWSESGAQRLTQGFQIGQNSELNSGFPVFFFFNLF